MKRTILFALMIPLLLTGCGARRDTENWKAFAETVETAERISFHAEITAHWEDSSASFGADVARAGGETHITLTAPETVSGITIRAKDGESATLWRDETGALTGAEITRDGRKILTLEITDWVLG